MQGALLPDADRARCWIGVLLRALVQSVPGARAGAGALPRASPVIHTAIVNANLVRQIMSTS